MNTPPSIDWFRPYRVIKLPYSEVYKMSLNKIIFDQVGNRYAGKTWVMKCYQEAYRRALGKAFGTGGNSHDRRRRRRWMPPVLRPFRQQIKENKQPFFIGS